MSSKPLATVAAGLCLLSLAAGAQDDRSKPNPEDVATANKPAGNRALDAMTVNPKLLTPDHWWKYKGPSTHRPGHYVVEQQGLVSLGGKLLVNHGAQVSYRVTDFGTSAAASKAWASLKPRPQNASRTKTLVTAVRLGDEAVEVRQVNLGTSREVQFQAERTLVRYGRYAVDISGVSDMKAFGPKPASGARAWLYEAAYSAVKRAALAKWAKAALLLPAADRP